MNLQNFINAFKPAVVPAQRADVLRVGLGAMLGIALAALFVALSHSIAGSHDWGLFAPLGASAVLLFAVQTSPLAQPWSCVVGNALSALWTWGVVWALPLEWVAPIAVGGAIMLMQWTRSLHPPGGAVALLMALEAQAGVVHPWYYAFLPIGGLTLCLVAVAMVYHRMWGKTYPLSAAPAATASSHSATQHLPAQDLSTLDLQALLSRFDQSNNLTAQDLGQLVLAAEEQAIARRFGSIRCAQVMSEQLWTCAPTDGLEAVMAKFQQHPIKSLPVVDQQGSLLGIVERTALLDWVWQRQHQPASQGQRSPWRWWNKAPAVEAATAADWMQAAPLLVQGHTPVAQLLETLAQHTVPFVAVQDGHKLVGLITRTDIMRLLLR